MDGYAAKATPINYCLTQEKPIHSRRKLLCILATDSLTENSVQHRAGISQSKKYSSRFFPMSSAHHKSVALRSNDTALNRRRMVLVAVSFEDGQAVLQHVGKLVAVHHIWPLQAQQENHLDEPLEAHTCFLEKGFLLDLSSSNLIKALQLLP